MKRIETKDKPVGLTEDRNMYEGVLADLIRLLDQARRTAAKAVNSVMTAAYWEIGRRIVEEEQRGKERAGYGEVLLAQLAKDLTKKFGRGFSMRNLYQMRSFYLTYVDILQTVSAKSPQGAGEPQTAMCLKSFSECFPLPWSHYVRLLSLKNPEARKFYETEALHGGWTVRQLSRQIDSQFYERVALSRDKASLLRKGQEAVSQDGIMPEEEIKDPLVLEFLGLRDEYSESDLEEALIRHLENFLLELGNDFAFVGRQRRLRIDDEWFRLDLLFFHRGLRCLVVIDLKLGKFTSADAGQMQVYLNYAREHWTRADENPPVGIILCASKGEALVHYATEGLPNKMLVREYLMALPDERLLAEEMERIRRRLEGALLPAAAIEEGREG